MDLGSIATQGVALLLGAVGGGLLGGVVGLIVAIRAERAAVAQLTTMQGQLTATQGQLTAMQGQLETMREQLAEAKRQFTTTNTPDVEVHVYVQGKPPEQRWVWLKATNHHPTITVNDLLVYAVGDSPSEKEAFTFMFTTFGDLKPKQSVVERSLQDLEPALKKHFPGYDSSGAFISEKPLGGDRYHSFPMKVHFSYLPRLHGAPKVEGVQDVCLSVLRAKSA
jgi:hypothetical protein